MVQGKTNSDTGSITNIVLTYFYTYYVASAVIIILLYPLRNEIPAGYRSLLIYRGGVGAVESYGIWESMPTGQHIVLVAYWIVIGVLMPFVVRQLAINKIDKIVTICLAGCVVGLASLWAVAGLSYGLNMAKSALYEMSLIIAQGASVAAIFTLPLPYVLEANLRRKMAGKVS